MNDLPEVRDNKERQRFELLIGEHVAFAEYQLSEGVIMFTHTEVPEALGGRGLSKVLVRAGLKSAHERKLLVMPACAVFAKYMREHPEEQDILHPSYRSILGL